MDLRSVSVGAGVLVALAAGGLGLRHWLAPTPAGAVAAAAPVPATPATEPSRSIPTIMPRKVIAAEPAPAPVSAPAPAEDAAPHPPTLPAQPPARLTRKEKAMLVAMTQLNSLRSTVALWKLTHDGPPPDFERSPRWEQFVEPDAKGRVALQRPPVNPFNGYVRVASVAGATRPGNRPAGGDAGWVYDRADAKLWVVGPDGAVLDDAAVDVLALEVRGAQDVPPAAARRYLVSLTQSLRSQVALYKLQHDDNPPDFARYPAWEQLRRRTSRDGSLLPDSAVAKGPDDHFYGPYVSSVPVNMLSGRYKVAVVAGNLKAGQAVPGDYGFVYSRGLEKIFSLDADGRVMPEPVPGSDWSTSRSRPDDSGPVGASVLQTVRSQLALYKLQHNDEEVDLVRYPKWEQLTGRTRVDGTPDPAGPYGPYLAKLPVNSRNGSSAVEVLRKVPTAYRTSKKVGFVQDGTSGRIWMVDERGAVMFE